MLQITLEKPGHFTATDGPAPTPAPGEALVRVHRIGVCGTDLHAFAGKQPFFNYPRILGHELGVEVIDPGADPHGLKAGDRCSVEPYLNCGRCIACRRGKPNCCAELKVFGVHADGGMRPVFAVPARKLHKSTTSSAYDQLALVETLGIGAHAVERAGLKPDDFVLVIGAGPIGLSVIQFVQLSGATLAVMDVSESRLEFCRKHLFGVKHTLGAGPDAAAQLKAHPCRRRRSADARDRRHRQSEIHDGHLRPVRARRAHCLRRAVPGRGRVQRPQLPPPRAHAPGQPQRPARHLPRYHRA